MKQPKKSRSKAKPRTLGVIGMREFATSSGEMSEAEMYAAWRAEGADYPLDDLLRVRAAVAHAPPPAKGVPIVFVEGNNYCDDDSYIVYACGHTLWWSTLWWASEGSSEDARCLECLPAEIVRGDVLIDRHSLERTVAWFRKEGGLRRDRDIAEEEEQPAVDPWEELIAATLSDVDPGLGGITTNECMKLALRRFDKADRLRVARIMDRLGWVRDADATTRSNGRRVRAYRPGPQALPALRRDRRTRRLAKRIAQILKKRAPDLFGVPRLVELLARDGESLDPDAVAVAAARLVHKFIASRVMLTSVAADALYGDSRVGKRIAQTV